MLTCGADADRDSVAGEERRRCPLARAWARLVSGHVEVAFVGVSGDGMTLAMRAAERPPPLSERDAAMLTRALSGDGQKNIADDFDVAVSTVSNRCAKALDRLSPLPDKMALPLVLAAQSFAGLIGIPSTQTQVLVPDGSLYRVVEIARPRTGHLVTLTPAEREVAQRVIVGQSRAEIAAARGTSPRTVSVQMRAIAIALGASGRPSLIRRAAELGCFDR
jgi:DNA-binding CsgD family transcriptional regulator